MTREEFNTWTADVCRKFPAIAAWLHGMGGAEAGMLADWAEVLSRTPFAESMQANRRMLAGDEWHTVSGRDVLLPGSFASDWQTLPAQVRRIAARLSPPASQETQ